jgi:SpoVK/Ycf46/Vps4 family AAA+-type ATPase
MADQKFSDALKQIDSLLINQSTSRHELLLLRFEISERIERPMPIELLLELAKIESENKNYSFAEKLLAEDEINVHPIATELKINLFDEQGKLLALYNEIIKNLLRRIENKNPTVPSWITLRIEKFFKNDLQLKFISLANLLHLNDLNQAEALIREIIIKSYERPSKKMLYQSLTGLFELLKQTHSKAHLEIYQSFCHLYLNGITESKDYKKLIETLIFFDDFKFQVMLLDLLQKLNLKDEAQVYSESIKLHRDYNFVYFDKYFQHLKSLFRPAPLEEGYVEEEVYKVVEEVRTIGSKLEKDDDSDIFEIRDSMADVSLVLKYQDFNFSQLCDLAVGFIQAELPVVAQVAAEKAVSLAETNEQFLKAKYLMMTSFFMVKDYRAAIDVAYEALDKSESKEDILSFLYGQAEALMKLKKIEEAKRVLLKIISIDETYRLAKMRLTKLNEI